jgi:Fe-S cluster biosynthesis and repair protein YggX
MSDAKQPPQGPRIVHCKKLGEDLPGMPFRPLPTEFGLLVFENVSMKAWQMWLKESPRLINTYRLDLQTKEGRDFLENQMRIFFGFEHGDLADTAWRPPEE